MPDDPTPPGHRARGHRSSRSEGHFDWRHPTSWTKNQRWGAGIGAIAVVVVILLVVLLVSAGTSKKPVVKSTSPTSTTAPTTSTLSHKTVKRGPPLCPLTGTPAPGGKIPMRPALAFKVDNYPIGARPWSGIDKADIVFEEPVEGFITRLVAVFQCQQAPLVGPIRSARWVDQGITGLLSDPILIHVGDIAQVANVLDNPPSRLTDINLIYTGSSIVYNLPGREAPYDTYASTSGGWGLVPKDKTPPAPVFQYSAAVPKGRPDNSLAIDFSIYSNETWTYHSASHTYTLSYANTGPATVLQQNGATTPLSTSNIVVQVVNYTLGPWVENAQGGLEVIAVPTGSGPLEVLRDGIFVRGTWSRSSLSAPLQLKSTSGSVIKLKPGPTWVDMVPAGQPVTPTP